MTSKKRLEQYINAQRKRRQPERDKRVCAAFRELLNRKTNELKKPGANLNYYFNEVTAIMRSDAYSQWFAREFSIENRMDFIESIIGHSPWDETDLLIKKLYEDNSSQNEMTSQIGQVIRKYSSYVSKRFSDSLGADYRRLTRADARVVYAKLGIQKVELGVDRPPSWEKISNATIRRVCMDVINKRKTDAEEFSKLIKYCHRRQTRKLLLKLAGYSRAQFSEKSTLSLLPWLAKHGLVNWKNTKEKLDIELTNKGKQVAELLKESD